MADIEELIDDVIDKELEMFLSVPADGQYACQQHPDQFRLHRRVQFSIWSQKTLESYQKDLDRAKDQGVNLMTVKYARMNNQMTETHNSPLVKQIFAIQYQWQQEMFEKYPNLMGGARSLSSSEDSAWATSFETYMKSELETYSQGTLSLLMQDLEDLRQQGINGSEQIYGKLVQEMGYDSIESVERQKK